MPKHSAPRAKLYTTIAFKAASLLLCVRAFFVVWNMGVEWRGAINDVDVFTIHMDRFWGPVHMLVPNNCTDLREKIATQEKAQLQRTLDLRRQEGGGAAPNRSLADHRSALGFFRLPDLVEPRDFAELVQVKRCDGFVDIHSDDPDRQQMYFAMIYLQPARLLSFFGKTKSATDTISEMKFTRGALYFVLFFGIFTDWILQVVLNAALIKEIAKPRGAHAGVQYKEIPTSTRTWWQLLRQYLGLIPSQCLSSCWSMSQQGCLLTLYITYWDENHYLMNYIPGFGYVCIYGLLFFFFLIALAKKVNDRCFEYTSAAACCYICVLVPAVVVPMGVWLAYNLNYLYQSNIHGVMEDVLSPEFPSAEHNAKIISFGVMGVNVLEMVLSPAIEVFYSK